MTGPILMCRYCGADSPRKCDFEDSDDDHDDEDRVCPWRDSGEYEDDLAEFREQQEDENDDEA